MMIYSICAMKRKRFVCLLSSSSSSSLLAFAVPTQRKLVVRILQRITNIPPTRLEPTDLPLNMCLLTLTICCRPSQVLNYSIQFGKHFAECGKNWAWNKQMGKARRLYSLSWVLLKYISCVGNMIYIIQRKLHKQTVLILSNTGKLA